MSEQTIPKDKWSLRDYLKGFDLHNSEQLEARADEILEHVRRVMTPYVQGERGDPLRKYYAPAVERIESAYENRDFEKEFPEALDFMIASVDWE